MKASVATTAGLSAQPLGRWPEGEKQRSTEGLSLEEGEVVSFFNIITKIIRDDMLPSWAKIH